MKDDAPFRRRRWTPAIVFWAIVVGAIAAGLAILIAGTKQ